MVYKRYAHENKLKYEMWNNSEYLIKLQAIKFDLKKV